MAATVCSVSMFTGTAFATSNPAALVLESSGGIVPNPAPYSEVDAGAVLKLGQGGHLVFVDFYSCMQVTVAGGEVRFSSEGYQAVGASQNSQVRIPCQREILATDVGEVAGDVLRGEPLELPHLSSKPGFVMVGSQADDFATVRVSQNGKVLLSSPIENRRFSWPTGSNALPAGQYELSLLPRNARASPRMIRFVVEDGSTGGQPDPLVLLRAN